MTYMDNKTENSEDNEIIAKLIEEITTHDYAPYLSDFLCDIKGDEYYKYTDRISMRIKAENIANIENGRVIQNNTSFKIKELGGYFAFIENKEKESRIRKERKTNEDDYYYWQAISGKKQAKTIYASFVLSIIAIVVSIIALIVAIYK